MSYFGVGACMETFVTLIKMTQCSIHQEYLVLIFSILQGSVVTHLRCGEKCDTSLGANLRVKEFLTLAYISKSYERISIGQWRRLMRDSGGRSP